MLSSIEQDRVEAAVAAAEDGSSGEIICVLAAEVSNYREVPLAWSAAIALALPPIALALGVHPLGLAADSGVWIAAQAAALESHIALALGLYAAVQAVLFMIVFLITHIPAVRRRLTPRSLKAHRVDRAAHQQFAAISARALGSETGILIFVALDDRQVRILADAGIHAKVGDAVWGQAVGAIGAGMKAGHDPTDSIIRAIDICGEALREHYPAPAGGKHVFKARPLEI